MLPIFETFRGFPWTGTEKSTLERIVCKYAAGQISKMGLFTQAYHELHSLRSPGSISDQIYTSYGLYSQQPFFSVQQDAWIQATFTNLLDSPRPPIQSIQRLLSLRRFHADTQSNDKSMPELLLRLSHLEVADSALTRAWQQGNAKRPYPEVTNAMKPKSGRCTSSSLDKLHLESSIRSVHEQLVETFAGDHDKTWQD
jgi:hypothetical protein